ncbi:enoyl-CoA hydratase/isomerase family protein [Allosphingosinicella deserti]|uniref:Enoyl-CoA hydratase n=1 Tax=Allosphingosinicella deserti TaxID=2116704 RepID=A0A2P7QPP7_9SPHN|nr:enoyl-CoA hydratase/isomerase family protein [Sphingomonas deserti]PSJ39953.1 enoyl-CoA hydratase [Sphingomonas deserti]
MLDLQRTGAIARLTLDRPEARNAVPPNGWLPIADLAERAVGEGARLLILAGRAGAFCAGADLGSFAGLRGDDAARAGFRDAMREAFDRIAALPIPTIAWIEGPCFGAGVALAMACDLRVATPSARFGITPAKLGISYPQQDIRRLVSLVGRGQATRLLFTAATIDADEALRVGLVEAVMEASDQPHWIESILGNSDAGLAALKRGIQLAAAGVTQDAEQDSTFDALIGGDELLQRLAALRDGR